MKRYFIDTCVLIWLLEGNKRVRGVAEDIKYCQGDFAASMEVVTEFLNLSSFGDIKTNMDCRTLLQILDSYGIDVYNFEKKHLKYLGDLPAFREHKNPYDRNIIAHAIADNRTLISGDSRFSLYEDYGLDFWEV